MTRPATESVSPAHGKIGCERIEVRLSSLAMRSRFELLLSGDDEPFLRAAGEEALEEIAAVERELSFFDPRSEISEVNRRAHAESVRVAPPLFELLTQCKQLWRLTSGCFDPTIGPLLELWGFGEGRSASPSRQDVQDALDRVGMDKVELNPARRSVRFSSPGVSINLGSIGKGYALDRAADVLIECGVSGALLHGGTSSVRAIGMDGAGRTWTIAVADPSHSDRSLAEVCLRDAALGVSGNHLNTREVAGRRVGHVIDPRNGEPVCERRLAAVVTRTGAEADALSTALLCSGMEEARWADRTQGALVALADGSALRAGIFEA